LAGLGVGGLLASVAKLAPQQCTFSGLPHASTLALDLLPSQIPLSSKGWGVERACSQALVNVEALMVEMFLVYEGVV